MQDITDRLAALGSDDTAGIARGATPSAVADADVARGRRALGRRRTRITAAAVVALAATGTTLHFTTGSGSHSGSSHPGSSRAVALPKIQLVDYTGPQETGYRIAEVPTGFGLRLQSSTPTNLVIAKVGDNSSPDAFVDKIVISAEEPGDVGAPDGQTVTVNGQPATLADDGTATQLWFPAHGVLVNVQSWDNIGLTHAQVVQFAEGITVTDQVQVVHG